MRVLVTGAAGRVGSTVARGLQARHEVRGHDRVPMPDLTDTVVSDLTDFDSMLEATRGVDARRPYWRSARRQRVGDHAAEQLYRHVQRV